MGLRSEFATPWKTRGGRSSAESLILSDIQFCFFRVLEGLSMPAVKFSLNGKPQTVDVPPAMPLLWVLRDTLGMTGTKFGCGLGLCGACTVHINGQPMRSCATP